MKNAIKPLIAAGLVLAGLPIASAAALGRTANRLATHAGATLRTAATLKSATPALRRTLPLAETIRALATLSQSHKSYSNYKPQSVDLAPLIPLGVVAAVTAAEIQEEQKFANSSDEELMEQLKEESHPIKRQALAFKMLQNRFNSLNGLQIDELMNELPKSDGRSSLILKILETKFDSLNTIQLWLLLMNLPDLPLKSSYIFKILDSKFDFLEKSQLCDLLVALPSDSEKKSSWILNTFETKFDSLDGYQLWLLLKNLPNSPIKSSLVLKTLTTKKDFLNESQLSDLVKELPSDKAQPFIDRILRESSVLEHLNNPRSSGPLFSKTFMRLCIATGTTYAVFQELLPLITQDATQEYTHKRIVFYHGQNTTWTLLSNIYQALYALKHRIPFPEDFIPLRFTTQSPLTEKDVTYLLQNGLSLCRGNYHRHVLFANLHLFANNKGSNTWEYITNNIDLLMFSGSLQMFIIYLTTLCNDLGFSEELETLKKDFITLHESYTKGVELHGNQGRLIRISMPAVIASRLSYSASSGGIINPLIINGQPTTDPAVIAAHFDQVPFKNEYCLLLTKEILDPIEAQKAGITMRAFSPLFDQQTKEGQEYMAALNVLIEKVKELYQARLAREAAGK